MSDPRTVALALAAVALFGAVGVGSVGPPGPTTVEPAAADSTASGTPTEESLVRPDGSESLLWPYTSAEPAAERRTLAINVVIHGERDEVRRALADKGSLEWNRTADNESEADAETHSVVVDDDGVDWSAARGSTRYTYVTTGSSGEAGSSAEAGQWTTPDYQLHAGTYLGTRQHVRAYESPRASDEWTAIQAHEEYWDWFRLRHSVTGVKSAAITVESEFIEEPYVSEVRREYRGNRGGGNDGWITAVELALALVVAGASITRTRSESSVPALPGSITGTLPSSAEQVREEVRTAVAEDGRKLLLPASMLALYLGVRMGGVGLEQAFPETSPKVFAGLLYPVLAVGVPVAAIRAARPLAGTAAFALAVGGLGAAFVLDFSTLGLASLSIRLVLHRFALLVSLGLLAAGNARADGPPDRRALALGTVGWVGCLLLPLFGLL